MLLFLSPFGSGLAIGPKNLPLSSSRLRRGYNRAPRGALLVDVGGLDALVAEPERDRRDVDALGLEQHRVGVSEDVRGDAFAGE